MQEGEPSFTALQSEPLIGIPMPENHVAYFTSDSEAQAASQTDNSALELLGVWSDLDWDHAVELLDRIRHESIPTPPIDEV